MFPTTPLYAICDAEVCANAGWTLVDFARACLDGGAALLQVRAKTGGSQAFLADAAAIVAVGHEAGATVIVNDRADIARLANADGVHVGQDDLPPRAVRALVPAAFIVGLSTHSDEQVAGAVTEPVDYVAIGPVFGTSTKSTGYEARGLEMVRRSAARMDGRGLPLVAIGGISLERAPAVIDAGARAVAVISDLLTTGDPAARVREFLRVLA